MYPYKQRDKPYARKTAGPTNHQEARERDEKILELADTGPIWAQLTVKLGLFKTYTPAARRLRKLNRKRKLRFIGRVLVGYEGNPSIIYCNQRVKEDTLETHEVPLSLMLSGYYPDAHVLRLYEVDKKLRPDASMHLGEATYHWEYDTGSEHKSQVKGQLNAYKDCPDTILFVCKRRKRIDTIKTIAEPVKDTMSWQVR